jgi:hypothetical protein
MKSKRSSRAESRKRRKHATTGCETLGKWLVKSTANGRNIATGHLSDSISPAPVCDGDNDNYTTSGDHAERSASTSSSVTNND